MNVQTVIDFLDDETSAIDAQSSMFKKEKERVKHLDSLISRLISEPADHLHKITMKVNYKEAYWKLSFTTRQMKGTIFEALKASLDDEIESLKKKHPDLVKLEAEIAKEEHEEEINAEIAGIAEINKAAMM